MLSVRKPENGHFRLSVADRGNGLSAEQISLLFQPFERLGAERTSVQGTGLGLALSKRLIEAMDATIGVHSKLKRGSTFWIELAPATPVPETIPELPAHEYAIERAALEEEKVILHIEDNSDVIELMERAILLRPNIRLISATTGEQGVARARNQLPDLILLDVHLPDLDGQQVLRELKRDQATTDIPVIILSADATPPQIESLIALGARAYVTKPIRVTHFLETIDQTLAAQDAMQAVKS
jgi:CheY-like chemotaxis protein